jgi:hypothetical protein
MRVEAPPKLRHIRRCKRGPSVDKDKYYLKYNVKLELLFNQWYAWPHLIPPATAAMNIANSHLKIMKSYVSAPEVHIAAVKNPAMRGGPFMNYPTNRANEVKALMEKTLREQSHMLNLARAIKKKRGEGVFTRAVVSKCSRRIERLCRAILRFE